MMRFNLVFALMAIGSAASAAEPIAVFSAHKDDILSSLIFESEGCCFGVGEIDVQGKSKLSEEMARKKSELAAQSDLLANQVLKSVKWPGTWPQQKISEARAFAKRHLNYSAYGTVRGLQVLYSVIKDGKCISVVGGPVLGLDVLRTVDFALIKKAMDDFEAEQRRLMAATNAPPANEVVSLPADTNKCPISSSKRLAPIDLGEGKKILMDNTDKDDLLF